MAGKPAARLTDMTAHGGTVVGPGVPTVLIGKMPAATMGDQHVCPMVTPGTPPIPHVGGPILLGSTGVFIGKKPAARVGDMAMCVGPPSQIVLGCFTVMVGEAGSGSQAGAAGAAAAATTKPPKGPKAVEAMKLAVPTSSPTQIHEIRAIVEDEGGRPLSAVPYRIKDPDSETLKGASSTDGGIRYGGYSKAGSYKATIGCLGEVKWSSKPVRIGQEVALSSETDADSGTEGFFFVSLVGDRGARHLVGQIPASVSGGALEAKWTLDLERWKSLLAHDHATYHGLEAVAMIRESVAVSKVVRLDTDFHILVTDPKGKPMANQDVEIRQASGQTVKSRTDANGYVKIKAGSAGVGDIATHASQEKGP